MTEKSYVTMEHRVCPVCTKQHASGALLLDRSLRNTFEKDTVTGWGLCEDHQAQFDDGYIFLIGADPEKSTRNPDGSMSLDGAARTGEVVALRKTVAERIIVGISIPKSGLLFCSPEVVVRLQEMAGG